MTDQGIEKGRQLVQWYAGWAATASAIPLPFVDMAGVMALQVIMVRRLARLHGMAMNPAQARTLLLSALGGAVSPSVTAMGVPSLLKVVPGIGSFLGSMVAPAAAGAATLAVGEFFNRRLLAGNREAAENAVAVNALKDVPPTATPETRRTPPVPDEALPPHDDPVPAASDTGKEDAALPAPGAATVAETSAKPLSGRRRARPLSKSQKATGAPGQPPKGKGSPS
jgi:uncharacterized protein (DUF697 family)